ncbi:hypothetical protein E0Z10_g1212 [Xylaria hypoxylon]|uniref:Protein kinase domain-containing protein n=1 Tax=Xylaria hypoxylon TaxID=37992 RepID=A0A4Z0Z7P7_9PEZI|nr:hypothetical protein E0Z10_g1212 [Xylaria hypoxylon]
MVFNIVVILFMMPLRRVMRLIISTLEHLVSYVMPTLHLSTRKPDMMHGSTVDEDFGTLRKLINDGLVRSQFRYNGGKCFLPLNLFHSLLTRDNIQKELPGASNELIDFVYEKAKRTFATVVQTLVARPKSYITLVMESFEKYGFDDTILPIDKEQVKEQLGFCPNDCEGKHAPALKVFHDSVFREYITTFSENQWQFLVPEFPLQKERRALHRDCILPFTESGEYQKEGGFSSVCKARLRVDHLKVMTEVGRIIHLANPPNTSENDPKSEPWEIDVAIKKFKAKEGASQSEPEIPAPKSAWSHEADVMEEFATSDLCKTQIVRSIGAFSTNGNYYIIMPWAEGGTLREFWDKDPPPKLSGTLIREFLEQYMEIATSLYELHSHRYPVERLEDKDPVERSNGISIRVSPGDPPASLEGSNWRHGDLKPENIFRKQEGDALGPLMIGDLGLAKKHNNLTRARMYTETRLGTMNYEPPEAFDNTRAKSRAYDIWSMGCIIVETIVWLLYGQEGQKQFYDQPYKKEQGTRYYIVQNTFPEWKLNDTTLEWIGHMLDNDPEFREKPSSALRDLLNLAMGKLLVVKPPTDYDNPEDGERTNAKIFRERLGDIIENSRNAAYLFTGENREGVLMPKVTNQSQTQGVRDPIDYPFNTEWAFVKDNTFALAMSRKLGQSTVSLQTLIGQPSLCKNCSEFDFWAKDFVIQDKRSDLMANTSCDFCKLRHGACIKVLGTAGPDDIRFNISLASSALTLNNRPSPALTICGTEELHDKVPGIQIGIPRLPDGEPRFEICRQWLEDCDTHDSCKLEDRFNQIAKARPTRLLDVGEENSAHLYLYETNEKDVNLKYLALSHPWGDKRLHSHFVTNIDNYENHKNGISEANLPDLFKDAIKLTRALRCRYIWIDSLCIKQGEGGDFESEAERMELVYSMAYGVIATTDATGNSDKFLIRESKRDCVKIDKDGAPFYVCEPIDDFQKHVLDGHLNTRGWVLQERALARRTIHCTKEQMYWECGEGIRCETMTKMKNEQAAFLGDPNFPLRAMQSTKGTKTLFYQVLYKQYSRLKFSQITDRRLGIAGLEQRLIRDFKVDGGFGVFQAPPERPKDQGYFGRSLLWKRGEEVPELTMIDYSKARPPASVPSWSWMAYKEGINYMEDPLLPFNEVVWETGEITSPWNVTHSSQSWHTSVRGQSTALRGTARSFSSAAAVDGEDIWYDRKLKCSCWDSGKSHVKCVRVGSAKKDVAGLSVETSYVLLVHLKPGTGTYERVGVAALKTNWVGKDNGIRVQIV